MIDLGFNELLVTGAVALIVIGPEKLPKVARTVGTLMGKARRYVADVKAEVNRSIELEELQKVKSQFETAAQDMQHSMEREIGEAQKAFDGFNDAFSSDTAADPAALADGTGGSSVDATPLSEPIGYAAPRKNWRVKRAAVPRWYKHRSGVRTHVQSGAARVARHRPAGLKR